MNYRTITYRASDVGIDIVEPVDLGYSAPATVTATATADAALRLL